MPRRTVDFGVDLGTTNSEIACIQSGEVRVFKNYLSEEFTPSVVMIDGRGSIIVGRKAYERHVDNPDDTAIEFKRYMGTQEVKEFKKSGKKMSPEELSSEVLKDLKITAKAKLSEEEDIIAAVIAVPCNFEVVQCEATRKAARISGIKYSPLLQEPIAASIAYGFLEKMPRGYWVVYDLGGGTFDIAIMKAEGGRLSVVDHCGNNYLGGKDFDWKIVEHVVYPALKQTYNLPGLGRSEEYSALNAILKSQAEQAKIELSQREITDIVIDTEKLKDRDGKSISINIPLKRGVYEGLIEGYVVSTLQLFEQALKNQGLSPGEINQLLLVGGPTMTPYIRHSLKDKFKIPVDCKADPLTVVAQGAAIFAATQLMPDEITKRDYSKVFIRLKYDPMTAGTETYVGGKIETKSGESLPEGAQVQINCVGGDWQSGKIQIKDNVFAANISLVSRKVNMFQLNLLDKSGNRIPSEPETFSITQGISIAEPPLIRSIGVELQDGSFDKIIDKGTSLPARSKPFIYLTARDIKPGKAGDVLNIHVKEGESNIAKRNRHVGTLMINGAVIQRPVPEGKKIEIVLSADQSRIVTAQAYIECLDQVFKNVQTDLSSPKPDPDRLSSELKKEQERFADLKRCILRIDDYSLHQKIDEAKVDEKISEINDDLQAAKGGDPDAVEKVDRSIRDLQVLLDPLERLGDWPVEIEKFNCIFQMCKEVVDPYGDNDDKDLFISLEKEAEDVKANKDTKKLERLTQEILQLHWGVLFKQDGFWISAFQEISKNPPVFSNQGRAEGLIKEGNMALQRQDLEALKTVVNQLWDLMPQDKQDEVGKKVSDSGLRKTW